MKKRPITNKLTVLMLAITTANVYAKTITLVEVIEFLQKNVLRKKVHKNSHQEQTELNNDLEWFGNPPILTEAKSRGLSN